MPSEHVKSDAHKRLRRERERAGFETAADFARNFRLTTTTYQHHENGNRTITAATAKTYARLLGVPAGLILYGEQLHALSRVPIVGTVSASGKIDDVAEASSDRPTANMPDPESLVGHRVVGDDLYPVYRDGDVIFHRKLSASKYDPVQLHGVECVVQLACGKTLLRQVTAQPDGRMTLLAYHAPPMLDQTVVAAAPVELVQRRLPASLSNR